MFSDLFDEMSKLFDDELFPRTKYSVPSFPPLKVISREKKVTFKFYLAGYKKEDLDVNFGKDCLILSTTKEFEEKKAHCLSDKKEKAKILVDTTKNPVFSYKYFIPEDKFDFEAVCAELKDGILEIVVPAREQKIENKAKKVEIKGV